MFLAVERKTIAIDKEIADKIADLAKRKGKTTFSMVNDILTQAISAEDLGLGCEEMVSTSKNFLILRDVNLRFVSREVYDLLMNIASRDPKDIEEVKKKSLDYGKWLGTYIKVRFQGDELPSFIETLQTLYSRTEEKYTLHVDEKENVTLQRISMFNNKIQMETESYIYEGVFVELGYELTNRKFSESNYELSFSKK